jgi:hypothetical protein
VQLSLLPDFLKREPETAICACRNARSCVITRSASRTPAMGGHNAAQTKRRQRYGRRRDLLAPSLRGFAKPKKIGVNLVLVRDNV